MGMSWTSYAASLFGAVKAAGMYEDDLTMMMGETGIIFHFIIEKNSCPSGPTVYNWQHEHLEMTDRIGIASSIHMIHKDPRYNTFAAAQTYGINRIRESIDSGSPVIVWAPSPIPEFGLITGYDDNDGIFFTVDCMPEESDPLLYGNLGVSEVSIMYVQTLYARVEYDREKTIRNSLRFGLDHWNTGFHESPNYGAGEKGWENLIGTLERRDFDGFGLTYTMNLYAESKHKIHDFLKLAADKHPSLSGLDKAFESSRETAAQMERITSKLPFRGPGQSSLNTEDVPEILECVRKAYSAERITMKAIETVLE